MSRIRGRDTKPELALRSMLHRLGYRFTVNGPKNKSLPGKPDLVLPKYRTVIFVHGCFRHGHEIRCDPRAAVQPSPTHSRAPET
jgi:DNA mismatch endonuclease (patch repair protein)